MRKLKSTDIFKLARLCAEIGIKEEVKKVAMKANNMKEVEEQGFELMFSIFEKEVSKKGEKAIFSFFAEILEEDAKVLIEMDPIEFLDKVLEVADIDKWKAFFSRVATLMK